MANSIDVLPYEEHILETECGRQWLFEEYFGEDMMARGFSHCTKVMARSGTAWGMWMVGGPVELRHRMSLQWTALDAKSEERQTIRRAEMWTHIAAIRSLGGKVHAHIHTHNLGVLDGLSWRR